MTAERGQTPRDGQTLMIGAMNVGTRLSVVRMSTAGRLAVAPKWRAELGRLVPRPPSADDDALTCQI